MTTPDDTHDSTTQSRVPSANGAWIKMRINLWDDPRVASLCDALSCDEARVCGGLYRMWSLADTHSTDGRLRYSVAAANRKVGIEGFAEAMQAVDWLVIVDGLITLPRFDEHNGCSAKRRAQEATRKANHRRRNEPQAGVTLQCGQQSGQQRDTSVSKSKKQEQEEDADNTHAGMKHESFRNASLNRSDGQQIRMTAIPTEHVVRIVRQRDGPLFAQYFADAVSADWAKDCEVDRVQMAALFHQVVRIGKAKVPGRVISKAWQNRNSSNAKLRLKLSKEDEDFGRLLMQPKPRDALPVSIGRLQSPGDDFDESEIAKRQRAGQKAAAAVLAHFGETPIPKQTRKDLEA